MVGGGGGGLVWVAGGWWCGGLGRGSWICDVVVRVGFGGVVRDGRVRSSLSFELAILPILFFAYLAIRKATRKRSGVDSCLAASAGGSGYLSN